MIVSINAGQDLGGTSIRLKRAFDRYSSKRFRSVIRSQTYLQYPTDAPWSEARDLWAGAEVVHLHNNFATAALFEQRPGDKPAVIHHHGTTFRDNAEALLREQRLRRAVGVAATLDLYLMAPDELTWLPTAYDVDWLEGFRAPIDDGLIRIATAPTDRTIKSTFALMTAVKKLKRRYPVRLDLIERQSWGDCLARKGHADIYFDQVKLGYGCNAIEAMGMGIPVVAGASPDTLAEYRRRFGEIPFHPATEDTIYRSLRELIEEPSLRSEVAQRGSHHARTFHDERNVTRQAETLYERAILAS